MTQKNAFAQKATKPMDLRIQYFLPQHADCHKDSLNYRNLLKDSLTHDFDSAPLMLDSARLKERVLLDPGAPTMMRGVLVQQHAMMQNRFSSSACVLAMPWGMLRCLP